MFFHHHAFRLNTSSDRGWVEVNTGGSWLPVDPENTPSGSFYAYYLGDKTQFKRGEVDLSSVAGEPDVRVRFRFTSDASRSDDGWFIDDVRLIADGTILFADDFESGTDSWALDSPWGLSLASYGYEQDLGSIDQSGHYRVTPVPVPVLTGDGMGYNAVRATSTTWSNPPLFAYARVHHSSPLFAVPPDLGMEDICEGPAAVENDLAPVHDRMVLSQNNPNPFNPTTEIAFQLTRDARASLSVYDQRGRLVRSLLSAALLPAGEHTVRWDGCNEVGEPQSSGVYFYRLEVGRRTLSRRMVMVR